MTLVPRCCIRADFKLSLRMLDSFHDQIYIHQNPWSWFLFNTKSICILKWRKRPHTSTRMSTRCQSWQIVDRYEPRSNACVSCWQTDKIPVLWNAKIDSPMTPSNYPNVVSRVNRSIEPVFRRKCPGPVSNRITTAAGSILGIEPEWLNRRLRRSGI
jgi:hypothetical protein